MSNQRGTVTLLLQEWETNPSDKNFQALLNETYEYLKRIAASNLPKGSPSKRVDLSPTVVVHEAYLDMRSLHQNKPINRKHWYNICAKIFRNKIYDAIRRENAQKRGGNAIEIDIDEIQYVIPTNTFEVDEVMRIESLLKQLENVNEDTANVFSWRFFLGCSFPEIAELSGLSLTTVKRKMEFAKQFITAQLQESGD